MEKNEEIELLSFRPARASEFWLIFWGIVFTIGVVTIPIAVILFLVAWIRIVSTSYRITSQRLFKRTGLIAKHEEEVELYRVQDVKMNQSILQRLLGIGDVSVYSSDRTSPHLLIRGIRAPEQVKETLRTAYREARKTEGVKSAEFVAN